MATNQSANTPPAADPATALKLALAWGLVGLPLLWGIVQTGIKAAALFK